MPELPEVEVVRSGLARHVVGATITAVEVLHPRPVRRDLRGPVGFSAALVGRRIEGARRRGKYLWLPLDNGDALLGHLGMSGQLLVQRPEAPHERHLRVRLALEGADEGREIRFVDQRMFGGLSVSGGGAELPPEIAHIARDPLDPEFDDEEFVRKVRRRRSGIKRQLLDQNLVSGVGNIYADEALWRARVNPLRPAISLDAEEVSRVTRAIRAALRMGIARQGSTLRDYATPDGASGSMQEEFRVYGRDGLPCPRCRTTITKTRVGGRGTWYCPRCQPLERL